MYRFRFMAADLAHPAFSVELRTVTEVRGIRLSISNQQSTIKNAKWCVVQRQNFLMSEVSDAGKDHRQAQAVGSLDHFLIAHRAARLDHCSRARLRNLLNSIGKRKESVGSCDGAFQREHSFHRTDLARV